MKKLFASAFFLLSTYPALAQTLDEQERLNQMNRALDAIKDLKETVVKMSAAKKAQCVTAIGNSKFCDCLEANLPVVIDFIQYVVIVNKTKEDLEYSKLSKDDKALVDNTRKTHDLCALR